VDISLQASFSGQSSASSNKLDIIGFAASLSRQNIALSAKAFPVKSYTVFCET